MTRNHVRLLLLAIAAAVSLTVALVASRETARSEDALAEARLDELRAGLGGDRSEPHPLPPGVTPKPCRSGERLAEALAELPPLAEADRAHLADFVDSPSPKTAQGAWPVLHERVPVLQEALDSAVCRDLTPPPEPPPLAGFAEAVDVVDVQVRALAWAGDVAGALRWTLDLWSVARDLQATGGFDEQEAGLDAIERMLARIPALLLHERLPEGVAARTADSLAHVLDRAVPLDGVLDRERRRGHGVLLGTRDPVPTRTLDRLQAYDRSLDALRSALGAPAEQRADRLHAWADGTDPAVAEVVPLPRQVGEIEARSARVDLRGRALLLVAALRAWPEDGCPLDVDALRASLSKETGARELVGHGVGYDADACEVIAMDPDGAEIERWKLP